jgi:fibro-slime domain-containing protein
MTNCCFVASALALSLCASAASAQSITLNGTIRDFLARGTVGTVNGRVAHPDFQWVINNDRGIVGPLGATMTDLGGGVRVPTYATRPGGTATTTNAASFNQWWRNDASVNMSAPLALTLTDSNNDGVYTYSNNSFFPINNQLLGNQGNSQNYHFTYAINTNFTFQPGQTFNFTGDDDLFVYVNGRLVVDLGGVHGAQNASLAFNTDGSVTTSGAGVNGTTMLGLIAGQAYTFDIFFAERHTTQSNFAISTNIAFSTSVIPLPPAAWAGLGTLGLLGLASAARRRKLAVN